MRTEAIVFTEADSIACRSVETPDLQPGQALVRALVNHVSTGTETRILRGGQPGAEFPCVPGYSAVGVVEDVCETEACAKGDLVFVPYALSPVGLHGAWGTHAGHMVVPAESLLRLDERRTPAEYAFSNVAAVALHGVRRTFSRADDTAVVVGQGLIGLLHSRIQVAMGRRVIGVDVLPWRLERSLAGGVLKAVDAREGDVESAVKEIWARGVQVAVEASGRQEGLNTCAAVLRSRGRGPDDRMPVLLVQSSIMGRVTLDARQAFVKDYMLVNSRSTDPCDLPGAIRMIGSGALPVQDLITLRARPQDAADAYRELLEHPECHMTCIFDWE